MKFNTLLLLPIALIVLVITIPPKYKSNFESYVTPASFNDTLPPSYLENAKVTELQGYKIQKQPGVATYYYKYKADHKQVLKELSALPFPADSIRADLQCRTIQTVSELKQLEALLKDERVADTFHQNEPIENYIIYQCLKAEEHFVLLSKNSNSVIHIIQQG
jgi:hypothetical protein